MKYDLEDFIRYFLSWLVLVGIFVVLVIAMSGCTNTKYVYKDRVVTDTLVINSNNDKKDSVEHFSLDSAFFWRFQKDSVYVKDSVFVLLHDDGTKETNREKETFRLVFLKDSIYILQRDSTVETHLKSQIDSLYNKVSEKDVEIEKVKKKNFITSFYAHLGLISFLVNIILIGFIWYCYKRKHD